MRGATGRMLRDLAKSMAREGWEVTVVCTGAKSGEERDGPVRVVRVKAPDRPGGIMGYTRIWFKLLRTALKQPATHLTVTMTDPPLVVVAGQIVRRFKKSRHIHWCQDLYPDLLPALGARVPAPIVNYFKKLSTRAMNKSDKTVVIGRCMAKHLTKRGLDPRQITMIPNWPDLELTVPVTQESFNDISQVDFHEAIAKYANTNHRPHEQQVKDMPKFRVMYAGSLGRVHPVETIIDAAEILRDENPEIEFVFVGDGPAFEKIAEERHKRHLTNVRLMPYQPQNRLRAVMESGDIHLISIKSEAAGLVVPCKLYSAMAVGRPCIFLGPLQTETAKVINDFKIGSVVAQGDTTHLVEEIKRYRFNGDDWFDAHHAAAEASQIYVPKDAINAWIERAWDAIEEDMREAA